jgi:hypothetical protein
MRHVEHNRRGFKNRLGCHVFRATGITAYLDSSAVARSKTPRRWPRTSPRTTKLYDRTGDQITLDEVEKIQI